MNSDQFINLIQTIFKIFGGALAAKGMGDSSMWEAISGAAVAVFTWYVSHRWNATPAAPASAQSAASNAQSSAAKSGHVDGRLLIAMFAFAFIIVIALAACAPLQPGADPIVVRTEQAQIVAASTFDMVLAQDNSDRSFWRTNAPAFHSFCEWLRQPQAVPGMTNTLPRDLAMQWNVDQVKLAYKSGAATSNALAQAVSTLSEAIRQASVWLAVVTNTPAKLQH